MISSSLPNKNYQLKKFSIPVMKIVQKSNLNLLLWQYHKAAKHRPLIDEMMARWRQGLKGAQLSDPGYHTSCTRLFSLSGRAYYCYSVKLICGILACI